MDFCKQLSRIRANVGDSMNTVIFLYSTKIKVKQHIVDSFAYENV